MEFPITVVYNMRDKKIGCVLLQAAMGSTYPPGEVSRNFDTNLWELNPSKCGLFNINSQVELDFMIRITHEAHEKSNDEV